MAAVDNPLLSVVVAIVSDTTDRPDASHLEPCLAALMQQAGAPAMEIIVPYHPAVEGIAGLRNQHPDVRFLEVPDLRTYTGRGGNREHHDELRARGLAQARGSLVALIEDVGIPARDWSARVVEAHHQPFAAVRGAEAAARQVVLRAEEFDIHLRIWKAACGREMLGQIQSRNTSDFTLQARLYLLQNGERISSTDLNDLGEFYFAEVPEGFLSIQVDLPHLTVIGALNTTELR